MKKPTWRAFVKELVQDFCTRRSNLTFTLSEFQRAYKQELLTFSVKSNTAMDTVRRVFQELAKEEFLFFVDNKGTYTLNLNKAPLPYQLDDSVPQELYTPPPKKLTLAAKHRREYLVETFVRKRSWVNEAKKVYGDLCLLANCKNSFVKEDGKRYIEAHHVVPLHLGGEDCMSNLSVVCAHHHRMAHFATVDEINKIAKQLVGITSEILKSRGMKE